MKSGPAALGALIWVEVVAGSSSSLSRVRSTKGMRACAMFDLWEGEEKLALVHFISLNSPWIQYGGRGEINVG